MSKRYDNPAVIVDVKVMCQCEHGDHERGASGHRYLGVRAGARRAHYVGLVCDDCATGHLADYLVPTA